MAKSIYLDKLHHVEHDLYGVLKEIFSFLSKCLQPILKGLCFIACGYRVSFRGTIYPYAIRRNYDCSNGLAIGWDFNNRLSLRIAFYNLVVRFMKDI